MTFYEFMQEHRLKWPHAYKAPLFHENLIKQGLLNDIVHFSSLNVAGIPIAWHLGFQFRNIYYYYMPVGNHLYSAYSPVKVHLFYLLSKTIHEKYLKFDHLQGEENYKSGWANGFDFVNNYMIINDKRSSKIRNWGVSMKSKLMNQI
jgi:CelD/BcsL family acetyltransferase involved in cellulose biosynthesis